MLEKKVVTQNYWHAPEATMKLIKRVRNTLLLFVGLQLDIREAPGYLGSYRHDERDLKEKNERVT